jgi:hypothetical protein
MSAFASSTAIVTSIDTARVGRLILMLSPTSPGEVVNAASALGRTLQRCGKDWHDLAAAATNFGQQQPPQPGHYSEWHWRSAAEFCAAHPEYLNAWEVGFISSIVKWRRTPTEKQLDCLEGIRQRVLQQSKRE